MGFELPEAITIARQMNHELIGKTIRRAHASTDCRHLIRQGYMNLPCHEFAEQITGKTVAAVTAQGKWVVLKLVPGQYLLLAPEMGGKILYHKGDDPLPEKYHLLLYFGDDTVLTIRIFGGGFMKLVPYHELEKQRYPGQLGTSPLDDFQFNPQRFRTALNGRNRAVKAALLDQQAIAGIGNSYLQDILFRSGIHPKRKVTEITDEERGRLFNVIRETMQTAVRKGGSAEEVDLYDRHGGYEPIMGRHMLHEACPLCGARIEKIIVLGSASYICPNCQK